MSDWEFLYDMHDKGYSSDDIIEASALGMAPWEISKAWIDEQLENVEEDDASSIEPPEDRAGYPYSLLEQHEIFYDLIECAKRHYDNTGRYLQVWGELGEIYAEIKFRLCRHKTHTAGSDGVMNGKLVEVKTISPEKNSDWVNVKRGGDFEQLLIVRINTDFMFKAIILERNDLSRGRGKYLKGRLRSEED